MLILVQAVESTKLPFESFALLYAHKSCLRKTSIQFNNVLSKGKVEFLHVLI